MAANEIELVRSPEELLVRHRVEMAMNALYVAEEIVTRPNLDSLDESRFQRG